MDIKHLFFEEEQVSPPIKPHNLGVTTAKSLIGSVPSPSDTGSSTKAYQRLANIVSFESTDYGALFTKYLTPLLSLPIEEHAKYKAALAQASAQEGLTAEKILATFDGLKTVLQGEVAHFEETASTMEKNDIADKQNQLTELDNKIHELQSQRESLSIEVNTSKQRINKVRTEFSAAVDKLSHELENQKAHYAGLLKG